MIFSKTSVLALCALSLNVLIFLYCTMVITDFRTTEGETPLFWASKKGHVEVVKMLLAHLQINVNQAKTTDGATGQQRLVDNI